MEALAKLAGWMIVITLSTLLFGWVATTIWGWYVVPAFHVATLKYKTAIGASYLVDLQFMSILLNTNDEYKKASAGSRCFTTMLMYLFLLGIAGLFYLVLP